MLLNISVYLQNLLFSDIGENAALKVVDFGFARLLSDESKMLTTPCYTLTYAAPEVLSTRHDGGYTEACDLWSIGVILVSPVGGEWVEFQEEDLGVEWMKLNIEVGVEQGNMRAVTCCLGILCCEWYFTQDLGPPIATLCP